MRVLRRLARLFRVRREEIALAEELEYHRAMIQADLESRGASSAEAAAASRRAMGNVTLAREDAREVWIIRWADQLLRDIRYGLRGLQHEPTFALASLLTLALGVGTTTAVFSIADAELWKPLPFSQPEQLVAITSRGAAPTAPTDGISGADLLDWRAAAPAFTDLTLGERTVRQVLQLDTAESVVVSEVTASYFMTLGRGAVAGRLFDGGDARGPRAAVLTERGWRRLFGGNLSVVGRSISLDGGAVTVVGIVRTDDSLGRDPDVFVSLDEGSAPFLNRSEPVSYVAIGRLRSGATADDARAQLQAAAARLAERHGTGRAAHGISVEDLRDHFSGYNWRPLYFFTAASSIVLVLSIMNVATLLVARAMRREREFALRGALGGGQGTLVRQLLVEGALLALPGGALGVLLASWLLALIVPAIPGDFLARGTRIPMDLRVVAFALAATGLSTFCFAL